MGDDGLLRNLASGAAVAIGLFRILLTRSSFYERRLNVASQCVANQSSF